MAHLLTSRRNFLLGSAATSLFTFSRSTSWASDDIEQLDIAIVGGGVAGLYSAMRLAEETRATTGVFESTDRIGGRLLSLHFPQLTSQTAEIGGMRLRNTDVMALKIVHDNLGSDALQDFDYPTTGFFLRDKKLSARPAVAELPYSFTEEEKDIIASGDDLLSHTFNTARTKYSDQELIRVGIWQLLLELRSKDAVNYIRDTLGYQSVLSNWNAEAALPWFQSDFAPGTQYKKIKGGIERIPHAAAAAYLAAGGNIKTEHQLVSMERGDDGRTLLLFRTGNGGHKVSAGKVILALPPHAIQTLEPGSFLVNEPRFAAAMRSVDKIPLAKIHFAFEKDWWTPLGMGPGRLISDLPIQQTYRWGVDPTSGRTLLMTSYHDGASIDFWESLSDGQQFGEPGWIDSATGPNGAPLARSLRNILPASEDLVEEAWRQVRLAQGLTGDGIAPPIAATYQNWAREPWGAAVHFWNLLQDPEDVTAYLREPAPNIHVCNEAWSTSQGWIHGATETAEAVLTEKFGLPPYVSG